MHYIIENLNEYLIGFIYLFIYSYIKKIINLRLGFMLFLYWVVNKNENKFGNLGQRAE